MSAIPYVHKSERFTEQNPPRENIRVRIDPQYHEIIVDVASLHWEAQRMNLPPEDAMPVAMIGKLRDQALTAYETVMRGGLTALAGRSMESSEVETQMRHYVEIAARRLEKAEAEAIRFSELAARRAIEVEALERALARRSDS